MKIAIVTFSVMGAKLGLKILNIYREIGVSQIEAVTTNDRAEGILPKIKTSLSEWVGLKFKSCDLVIFVGACGIAVRKIAPFVSDKKTDSAVLVIDDTGKNVISLLSGHLGGGNEQALFVAERTGANPVITTASDCSKKIAVDLFAKKNQLVIFDYGGAKDIESAILDGENIGFVSEFPTEGKLPEEFVVIPFASGQSKKNTDFELKYGIEISLHNNMRFEKNLHLLPRCIVAGVGCKRGKTKEEILQALNICFEKVDIPIESLCKICTIDLKKDEEGLIMAAGELGSELEFYNAGRLMQAEGIFNESEFVRGVTGVDNVCERAAALGAGNVRLLLEKTKIDGVTVALAIKERGILFE